MESVAKARRDTDWEARIGANVKLDFKRIRFASLRYFVIFYLWPLW